MSRLILEQRQQQELCAALFPLDIASVGRGGQPRIADRRWRRFVLVVSAPRTMAGKHRHHLHPETKGIRDGRSNGTSPPASPAASNPIVKNRPASTAKIGAHHQRPRAINAAGISRMKNTGGTVG